MQVPDEHVAPPPGPGGVHPPRGRLRATAVVLVVFAAIAAVIATRPTPAATPGLDATDAGVAAAAFGRPTTTVASPSLEVAVADTEPVITLPPLPLPEDLPSDWYAPTALVPLGTIEIPRIGVRETFREGITLSVIDHGPGHWAGTPMPGELGNMVIPGHRVTHSAPFNRLDQLVAGDLVHFTTEAGRFTYRVRGTIIAQPEAVGIAAQPRAHVATLFACHPKGSATQRIVVKLQLLDAQGNPVDADDALPPLDVGLVPERDNVVTVRKPVNPGQGDVLPDESTSTTIPQIVLQP
jgi:sortase A